MKLMRPGIFITILAFSGNILMGQETGYPYQYPYQDPSLGIDVRVENLISLMTLEEKVSQLTESSAAIPRLEVPAYNWWNECLHGVARNGRATVFPQAIGMAATWDQDLMHRIGGVIAEEARAKYNVSQAHGLRGRYQGLTFWTPNVNIFRDPRWGRGQETYGEDPFLTSRMAVSFVRGLQGDHPEFVKAAALAKHYAVHSGPEALRHEFDARVSRKDLWETYLPAFEALAVEAKVEGFMGAYNRTNGDPCIAHPYLIQEVLRQKWGYDGYIVSDCGGIRDLYNGHDLVETRAEAAALALNAGTNLNCGSTYEALTEAVEKGYTSEAVVDQNLRQLLPTRFRLGLFDPPGSGPFDSIGPEVIRSEAHVALARETAAKSMVLLKNKAGLLPLSKDIGEIFVTGPMATHAQALLANYFGVSENLVTFLEGIVGNTMPHASVKYRQGVLLDIPNRNPVDWATGSARGADATIACVGISQLIEGEEGESIASPYKGDRVDIKLPQNQLDYLEKLSETTDKLVVVVTAGSAVDLSEIYDWADALILAWYPGEQGGNALADVLFGDVVPSGRLPVTFPYTVKDLPTFEDYAMEGRTYRYMKKEPMFPFGFGLSYHTYTYSDLMLSKKVISEGESVRVSVKVTNNGALGGEEVVQLYVTDKSASVRVPFFELRGVQHISVPPGAITDVAFELHTNDLELVNEAGERVLEPGDFLISVGGSLPTKRSLELGASPHLEATLKVE